MKKEKTHNKAEEKITKKKNKNKKTKQKKTRMFNG